MPLTLTWLDSTTLPVDAASLQPASLAGHSNVDVGRLLLPVGRAKVPIGELFRVEGSCSEDHQIQLVGDLTHLRRIGSQLETGQIEVDGDAGPYLGVQMRGGTIEVRGNVGARAASELAGGLIRIRGSAGPGLGGPLPGSSRGMRDGVVLVEGAVGDDAAHSMRRGLIAVRGRVAPNAACNMIAGTFVACGEVEGHVGLGMKRGTIVIASHPEPEHVIPPTFARAGRFQFPFLAIYARRLADLGFPLPGDVARSTLRYNGDRLVHGQGEVLVLGSQG